MNEALAARDLFSDAPADDERWLRLIYDETGAEPTFTIPTRPSSSPSWR